MSGLILRWLRWDDPSVYIMNLIIAPLLVCFGEIAKGGRMKPGDVAIHRRWHIPVLLIGTCIIEGHEYWEVYYEGEFDLFRESDMEIIDESR